MKDIATQLGVSVATVSRALKDSHNISKERREMIQQYARDHNYYPNVIAEQLRHSRKKPSQVIGVIIPEFIHNYFSSILTGIEEEASKRGYRIMAAQSGERYDREQEICQSFMQNKVCGIIVSQAKDTTVYEHFEKLVENGIPLVFYDRICPALNASRVVVDDYQGAFNAVSHLAETGCKRIAFFGASMSLEISQNRYNGYKDALYRHGLEPDKELAVICDNREDAEKLAPDLLKRANRPDAFFAVNDDTAIGILHVARRLGLRVPEDVAICGFGNDHLSTACDPQLTTVEQRGVDVGREAANVMIDTVEGILPIDKAAKRVIKTRLLKRGTTR